MLRRALLALSLGLLTTLVIAWGLPCAMIASAGTSWNFLGWNPGTSGPEQFWADDGPPFPHAEFSNLNHNALLDFANTVRASYWDQLGKRDRSHPVAPPSWAASVSADGREGYALVLTAATGWPLRCFRGELWSRWHLPMPPPRVLIYTSGSYMTRDLWPVPLLDVLSIGVPHQPLWPGLIVNVTLFTGLWLPVLFALSTLRRTLRLRRRHCPHCNYDLRGTPPVSPCPECGAAAKRPAS